MSDKLAMLGMFGIISLLVAVSWTQNDGVLKRTATALAIHGPAKEVLFGDATLQFPEVRARLQAAGPSQLHAMAEKLQRAGHVALAEKLDAYARVRTPVTGAGAF